MKYSLYISLSFALASSVLLRAFYLRPNFWSATILLSQSNGSLLILTNLALICTASTVYGLQRILYGRLRAIEIETLYEKGWVAITETALAMTIFREDIGTLFFVMFLALIVGKIWLWIGEGRVEYLEQQPPADPRLLYARLAGSLLLSIAFDLTMCNYCFNTIVREARPGMMVMYAFEFAILGIQSISTTVRFCLNLAESFITHKQTQSAIRERREELRREREQQQAEGPQEGQRHIPEDVDEEDIDVPGWEAKGRWIFYLDLLSDFIKSVVYCVFFFVLLAFHGLPLHIMRDLYITVRSFVKRILDFVQYRNATKDMNERYPDATAGELEADNTCIICREEMHVWQGEAGDAGQGAQGRRHDERLRPKKLPCGHILHFGCLRSWLERQRVCPTCRRNVLTEPRDQSGAAQQAGQQNNVAEQAGQIPGIPGARQPHQHRNRGHRQEQGPQLRVFNFGPLRIAFGRGHNALARAAGVNPQQPIPQLFNGQQQANNAATTPMMIGQQIIQLQGQVLQLMQQLNGENLQLDVLHRLVTELARLQTEQNRGAQRNNISQGMGMPFATQHLPVNNLVASHGPQAYQASPLMAAGHPDLPQGMVLPPGYSLQRLQPVNNSTPATATQQGTAGPSDGGSSNAESSQTNLMSGGAQLSASQSQPAESSTSGAPTALADSTASGSAEATAGSSTGATYGAGGSGEDDARRRAPQPASVEDA